MNGLYHLDHARNAEQADRMARMQQDGVCILCPEHIDRHCDVLGAFGGWKVVRNRYPYRGARTHGMLVPRAHHTDLRHLPAAVAVDLPAALIRACRLLDIGDDDGWSLGVRSGDMAATGATIGHLHLHLIAAPPSTDPHDTVQPVEFRMSGRPAGDIERG